MLFCSRARPGNCADIIHARQSGLVRLLANGPAVEILADAGDQGLSAQTGGRRPHPLHPGEDHALHRQRMVRPPLTDAVRQLLELDGPAFRRRIVADAARRDARDDALCHPPVLNRWRDQLTEALAEMAPSADNPHTKYLHDLTLTSRPRSAARLGRLHDRRRLFATLLQRRSEAIRLITALNDGMSLAERRDPGYELLKKTGDQAYDELVRRHPGLYRYIRTRLARYETRYGRLQLTEPRANCVPGSTTSWTACAQHIRPRSRTAPLTSRGGQVCEGHRARRGRHPDPRPQPLHR
ncbi:hypothetical protein ACFY3N_20415 [Streptomyces sp. NPDC000348]|uniref:hypothetical protein n=1 Tax=Streptomyces sp. NPDC000348 TaxID=3364538 RepID=UPI0036B2ACEC